MPISFILNNEHIDCSLPHGTTLLDYIRYHRHAMGSKIGCREGDCGACTVLIGDLDGDRLRYRSITSCLFPIGNVAGKHVVTIEGLNLAGLSPVQQAVVDEGGTQCGFCTVGFVVSLTGFCMDGGQEPDLDGAIAAMNGNICRCTGYKSLERAADVIVRGLLERDDDQPLQWLIDQGYLPAYFSDIPKRLKELAASPLPGGGRLVGGGTDLYVQRPEEMAESDPQILFDRKDLVGICEDKDRVVIGAATTAEMLNQSAIMQCYFPDLAAHMKLVSSTQIRNMGTLAGNFVNASPIGDLTVFFLALDASLHMQGGAKGSRTVALKDFYQSYKVMDLLPQELIVAISFAKPGAGICFNFEKVCKRTHLDIASVNSAIQLEVADNTIIGAHISAGGVYQIPFYLKKTAAFLAGKAITEEVVSQAAAIADGEISPISDIRGSESYKRLLLRQLIYAHFLTLFPDTLALEALV